MPRTNKTTSWRRQDKHDCRVAMHLGFIVFVCIVGFFQGQGVFPGKLLCWIYYLETEYRLFPPVTIFLDLFPCAGYFFNASD